MSDDMRGSLEKALQENWNHARHDEILRERYTTLYWFLWAAVLGYVGRQGDFVGNVANNWALFGLLALMSSAVLLATLKWNSEFANHMSAAAAIAEKLDLNIQITIQPNRSVLPYKEFKGYMALPLNFPLFFNVAVWIAFIHLLGLFLASLLFLRGAFGKWTIALSGACLIGVMGIVACYYIYGLMHEQIANRNPEINRVPHSEQ